MNQSAPCPETPGRSLWGVRNGKDSSVLRSLFWVLVNVHPRDPQRLRLVSLPNTAQGAPVAAAGAEQGSESWWPQRCEGTRVRVPASVGGQQLTARAHPPVHRAGVRVLNHRCTPLYTAPALAIPILYFPAHIPHSSPELPTPRFPLSFSSFCLLTVLVPFPNSSMRTRDCLVALFTAFATCWAPSGQRRVSAAFKACSALTIVCLWVKLLVCVSALLDCKFINGKTGVLFTLSLPAAPHAKQRFKVLILPVSELGAPCP